MQAKFTALSFVLSALFVSQVLGAVPRTVDCSLVRCAAPEWSNPVHSTAGSVTLPGNCCPTCVTPPDCSAVQCLACPADTIATTVPGQCCPTCTPKPDCKNVLCVEW
ncbi:hypothetical protein B0H14DRAFT_2593729 [Mycena olivaceomarginata]|nr:hypothetical protein B0H14DRAFT_2593729 [Mycena olivaceomarginata]